MTPSALARRKRILGLLSQALRSRIKKSRPISWRLSRASNSGSGPRGQASWGAGRRQRLAGGGRSWGRAQARSIPRKSLGCGMGREQSLQGRSNLGAFCGAAASPPRPYATTGQGRGTAASFRSVSMVGNSESSEEITSAGATELGLVSRSGRRGALVVTTEALPEPEGVMMGPIPSRGYGRNGRSCVGGDDLRRWETPAARTGKTCGCHAGWRVDIHFIRAAAKNWSLAKGTGLFVLVFPSGIRSQEAQEIGYPADGSTFSPFRAEVGRAEPRIHSIGFRKVPS